MVATKPIQSRFSVIDLFAGAGGFSLAAHNCGFDVIAAVEFDLLACETYRKNIIEKRCKAAKLRSEDILKIDPAEFRKNAGFDRGQLDLLVGGPPCQGFSSHRLNDEGVSDPRNQLLLRYFDFVKEFNPKFFLVENVPGLLWSRHELYLQKFKALARANGYKIFGPTKLNAKEYGVPQNRERVFILGVRNDRNSVLLKWPPDKTHGNHESNLPLWKNASAVFEKPPRTVMSRLKKIVGKHAVKTLSFGDEIKTSSADKSAIHMLHTQPLTERFNQTPINGSREDLNFRLPCHEKGHGGHKDVYGRIRLAQPGPTMTTGCFNPSKGRFLHPWKNHGITVRHAARFQTFPDDFIFSGGITSQGQQVGNAVPIHLAESVILVVKAMLEISAMPNQAIA